MIDVTKTNILVDIQPGYFDWYIEKTNLVKLPVFKDGETVFFDYLFSEKMAHCTSQSGGRVDVVPVEFLGVSEADKQANLAREIARQAAIRQATADREAENKAADKRAAAEKAAADQLAADKVAAEQAMNDQAANKAPKG